MGVGFGCLSNDSSLRLDGHKVDTEDPNLFLRLLREQHSDVWAEAFERRRAKGTKVASTTRPGAVARQLEALREVIKECGLRAAAGNGGAGGDRVGESSGRRLCVGRSRPSRRGRTAKRWW